MAPPRTARPGNVPLLLLAALVLLVAAPPSTQAQLFGPPPPSEPAASGAGQSVVDVVCGQPDLSTLCRVAEAALGDPAVAELLDPTYTGTLFAPVDEAFRQSRNDIIEKLSLPSVEALTQTPGAAARLIKNHIVLGAVQEPQLTNGLKLRTVAGEDLTISTGWLWGKSVNDAAFVGGGSDIPAGRSFVHKIEAVLVPGK